ncbi:MAG: TatD family hydrolase [Chloroflexota bacterium]|nr:TatD family hydrolase [Chloroflexota bacterium]
MQLVDTHLHLDFKQFDEDRAEVVERAVAEGVTAMITIGTSLETSERAVELAEQFEPVWAAVGIHPNDAAEWGPETDAALRGWTSHPKVVAIGEIGLDYYWERVPHDVQQRAFEEQLNLAAELDLPVIIHDRDAHEDIMATLRGWVSRLTADRHQGVLHFFSGDLAMAEEALDLGFYLGTDGPVTFKNARDLQEVIAAVPLERLLVETDAPFLTPHPYRGRRNEPAYVRYVAEQVAALHGTTMEKVAAQTTSNALRLFGLEQNA